MIRQLAPLSSRSPNSGVLYNDYFCGKKSGININIKCNCVLLSITLKISSLDRKESSTRRAEYELQSHHFRRTDYRPRDFHFASVGSGHGKEDGMIFRHRSNSSFSNPMMSPSLNIWTPPTTPPVLTPLCSYTLGR